MASKDTGEEDGSEAKHRSSAKTTLGYEGCDRDERKKTTGKTSVTPPTRRRVPSGVRVQTSPTRNERQGSKRGEKMAKDKTGKVMAVRQHEGQATRKWKRGNVQKRKEKKGDQVLTKSVDGLQAKDDEQGQSSKNKSDRQSTAGTQKRGHQTAEMMRKKPVETTTKRGGKNMTAMKPFKRNNSKKINKTLGKFTEFTKQEIADMQRWLPVRVVKRLVQQLPKLEKMLQNGFEEDETSSICDLLGILAKACSSPRSEELNKILCALKGSPFVKDRVRFFLHTMVQDKGASSLEFGKEKVFLDMIKVFETYLRHFPNSFADPPLEQMQQTLENLTIIGKETVEDQLVALKKERDEIIRSSKRNYINPFKGQRGSAKPPNDFREISICPTIKEVTSNEQPFLRANIKKGTYEDAEHYLDVQFRLYREDFLAPLREGIQEITTKVPKHDRNQNIKVYHKVRIVGKEYTNSGIIFRLKFDISMFERVRWANSKRLIFGSFLCMSKDNFASMIFATVADRSPEQLSKGVVMVKFVEGQDVFDVEKSNEEWMMAESPSYFEAYRHVLIGMQNLREDTLPFKKYLVDCNPDVDTPAYLQAEADDVVYYDLTEALTIPQARAVPLLDTKGWPDVSKLPLNDSQYEALKTALTKEFSVIQGPPGTGKTYVGLKIVRCLLNNSKVWNASRDSPILMVCFTNHALDQFLEGILEFLKKGIVRVGSRCKSEKLEQFNLRNLARTDYHLRRNGYLKVKRQEEHIQNLKMEFKRLQNTAHIAEFNELENVITQDHVDQFYNFEGYGKDCPKVADIFMSWLCHKKPLNQHPEQVFIEEDVSLKAKDQFRKKENGNYSSDDDTYFEAEEELFWEEEDPDLPAAIFYTDQENERFYLDSITTDDSVPFPNPELQQNNDPQSTHLVTDNKRHNQKCLNSETLQDDSEAEKSNEATLLQVHHSDQPTDVNLNAYLPRQKMGASISIEASFMDEKGENAFEEKKTSLLDEGGNGVTSDPLQPGFQGAQNYDTNSQVSPSSYGNNSSLMKMYEASGEDTETVLVSKIDHDSVVAVDGKHITFDEEMETVPTHAEISIESVKPNSFESLHSSNDMTANSQVQDALNDGINRDIVQGDQIADAATEYASGYPLETIDVDLGIHIEQEARYLAGEEDLYKPITFREVERTDNSTTNEDCVEQWYQDENDDSSSDEEALGLEEINLDNKSTPYRGERFPESALLIPAPEADWQRVGNKKKSAKTTSKKAKKGIGAKPMPSMQGQEQRKRKLCKARPKDQQKVSRRLNNLMQMYEKDVESVKNIWHLSQQERLRLYLSWKKDLQGDLKREIVLEETKYENICQDSSRHRAGAEERTLRRAKVIGMTTTGAARYHSMLQRICPRIVIIEEAAEVLEAHIITSLASKTEHVILIGDHKQLRPKPTVHDLAKKYNLEVSLFERMVINKMDCKMLAIQHRMRPEIAELTKRIYDHEIQDHASVKGFENIRGLERNLFFIDHQEQEKFVGGLQSYANAGEADFVVALCKYLIQQEYRPQQITVLTMYTGQLLELKEKMPRRQFEGVRVSAVDNFQGEENDIILLSLVRSNKNGSIGFLKESNRICVALSRARQGFYCIGDFGLLAKECKLWDTICDDLRQKEAIGGQLHLVCQRHKNVTEVRKANDISKVSSGGCGLPCDLRLPCGHTCQRKCHPNDAEHVRQFRCEKPCLKSCSRELHQCQRQCHGEGDCGSCPYPVMKAFPDCDHEVQTACGTDMTKLLCCTHVEKTLPCGHRKMLPCHLVPDTLEQTHDQFKETCAECTFDRKHIKKSMIGCQTCSSRNCNKCSQRYQQLNSIRKKCTHYVKYTKCKATCPNQCLRGHKCGKGCHHGTACRDCTMQVEIEIPQCGHKVTAPCYTDPSSIICKQQCEKELRCGHTCNGICGEDVTNYKCIRKCHKPCERGHKCMKRCHFETVCGSCVKLVEMVIPKCEHKIRAHCYADPSSIICNQSCDKELPCGHICKGACGKDCTNYQCKEQCDIPCKGRRHKCNKQCHFGTECDNCVQVVEQVILKCGHKTRALCHADPLSLICNQPCDKKLSCGHSCKRICREECKTYLCKQKCHKPCEMGHKCKKKCHFETACGKCVKVVEKVIPKCGHKVRARCHADPSSIMCDLPCEKELKCGHVCKGICGDMATYKCKKKCHKPCERGHKCNKQCHFGTSCDDCVQIVGKTISKCGHQVRARCHADPSTVICNQQCKKELKCEHICKGICGEECKTYQCKEKCDKTCERGHKCNKQCHFDTACDNCVQVVEKLVPKCGHRVQALCHADSSLIDCNQLCEKELRCGHACKGVCGEDCTIYECKEKCEKTCEKGHKCNKQCHFDTTCDDCEKVVEKVIPKCGHQVQALCHADSSSIDCNQPCEKELRCGHACKGVCGENCTIYECKERCKKTCEEGHKCNKQCHFDTTCDDCEKVVEKVIPRCGHQVQTLCHADSSSIDCNQPCEKPLECGHACEGVCGENCTIYECKERCKKTCEKGHKCNKQCHFHTACNDCDKVVEKITPKCDDKKRIPFIADPSTITYRNLCLKKLGCGHICKGACGEDCVNYQCKEMCDKTCERGHKCGKQCHFGTECDNCIQVIEKVNPKCGHKARTLCHADPSTIPCSNLCVKERKCGHLCKGVCGEDCSTYQCKERCEKTCDRGHKCNKKCHSDIACDNCMEVVEKKIPKCGHKTRALCHADPSMIPCSDLCLKERKCGHLCKGVCGEDCSTFQCKERCAKTCERGHKCNKQCHSDTSCGNCMEVVEKTIPICGHKTRALCHADPSTIPCSDLCLKERKCGHLCKGVCGEDCSTYECKENCKKACERGHKCNKQCHSDTSCDNCMEVVEKKIPKCGHKTRALCHADPSTIPCSDLCLKERKCGHLCKGVCGEDCSTYQCKERCAKTCERGHKCNKQCHSDTSCGNCMEVVEKKIPICGHKTRALCHADPSTIPCSDLCLKERKCGHLCKGVCGEDCSTYQCKERCAKTCERGHKCNKQCHSDTSCGNCMEVVEKKIPICGHKTRALCHADPSTIPCSDLCLKERKCGHLCKGVCGEDCSTYQCKERCAKTCERGHKCNKQCHSDTSCGNCMEVVEKKIPICGHKTRVLCHADPSTIPCSDLCLKERKCGHLCKGVCGEDCSTYECKENCKKACEMGHKCNKQCHSDTSCDNCMEVVEKMIPECGHEVRTFCHADPSSVFCNQPCEKPLECGHICKGICGEDCSTYECKENCKKACERGHKCNKQCHFDSACSNCMKVVEKNIPKCGHRTRALCHDDPSLIMCNQPCEKELRCGHICKGICWEDCNTYHCQEICGKPCERRHKCAKQCHFDTTCGNCVKVVEKINAKCGHIVNVPCYFDPSAIMCKSPCKRQLSCGHSCGRKCGEDCSSFKCKELVLKTRPCGHLKTLECNTDPTGPDIICHEGVIKNLSCGHTKKMSCSEIPQNEFCDFPCKRTRKCGHQCRQRCGEKCEQSVCTELTRKELRCPGKHSFEVQCFIDATKCVCHAICTIKLDCGHIWQGKCSSFSDKYQCNETVTRTLCCPGKHQRPLPCSVDVNTVPCLMKCTKTLPCGHQCLGMCGEPCQPKRCKVKQTKKFQVCGHKKLLPCGIAATAICKFRCLKPRVPCGHPCKGFCGESCTKRSCSFPVTKPLSCGHRMKLKCGSKVICPAPCKAKLPCGHLCLGTCGICSSRDEHEQCSRTCGRLLVCSHRCQGRCADTCPPCSRKCRGWCPHGKCRNSCGTPCDPCEMPCALSCPHRPCSNLCHEMCDLEPCNKPCQKVLPKCGHPCLGLCGESCPKLCWVCNPRKVEAVSPNGKKNKDLRFIQLEACGHIVEVGVMDEWMGRQISEAEPRRCPECSVPVYYSFRYGNAAKKALRNAWMENVAENAAPI